MEKMYILDRLPLGAAGGAVILNANESAGYIIIKEILSRKTHKQDYILIGWWQMLYAPRFARN